MFVKLLLPTKYIHSNNSESRLNFIGILYTKKKIILLNN